MFMNVRPNALVIQSNLATPISKKVEPGYDRYSSEPPEDISQHTRAVSLHSHVVVPDMFLENPAYSVYAFIVPNPVILRVVSGRVDPNELPQEQRTIARRLERFRHGVNLELAEPNYVDIGLAMNSHGWGMQWQIQGIATSRKLGAELAVEAFGVRGHAVAPIAYLAGQAILENI